MADAASNFLWLLAWIHCAALTFSSQSELQNILTDTDRFFRGLNGSMEIEEIHKVTRAFMGTIKRSYGFLGEDEHPVRKRSLDGRTTLVRDEKGVFRVKDIQDVARIPVKFPNDLQIVTAREGVFYIAALESNGNSPQTALANHLVIYEYMLGDSVKEEARVPTSGGYRLASFNLRNVTYMLTSEHEAENEAPFEGSTLYSLQFRSGGGVSLDNVQILNITRPKDLKFLQHQEQVYLFVSTDGDVSGETSHILVYRWLGHNFDLIQKIQEDNVKCLVPFVVDSFIFLAVANFQDKHGNTEVESSVYRLHLQSEKLSLYQKISGHAANDVSYFNFRDSKLKKEEHFLAVANYFEIERDGSRNYNAHSVVYKYEDEHFVPFQNFKLHGALHWVPVKGPKGEFLIIAICTNNVIGYQYDGWRFTEINMDYGQSFFGRKIASVRPFIYNSDVYLTVADKSNYETGINLWKITFQHENALERSYGEVEAWCKKKEASIENDGLNEIIKKLHSSLSGSYGEESSGAKLNISEAEIDTLETNSFDVYDSALIDDLNAIDAKIEALAEKLRDVEEKLDSVDSILYHDVAGVTDIPYLELNCSEEEHCSFDNLNIGELNGEDFWRFLDHTVTVSEDIVESVLEFENVNVAHELMPNQINGQPAQALMDTESDIFLNSELVVNGTVVVRGDLRVGDAYSNRFAAEEDVLTDEPQHFNGELVLGSAVVNNLEIAGLLNGVDLETLTRKPSVQLRDAYDRMNVHDLNVNGTIAGFEVMSRKDRNDDEEDGSAPEDSGTDTLEVKELWVDSGEISGVAISDMVVIREDATYELRGNLTFVEEPLEVNYLDIEETINGASARVRDREGESGKMKVEVMVVEGTATMPDIMNLDGSLSVSDILSRGIFLEETTLAGNFVFSQVKADELFVERINDDAVSSWVSKNFAGVQYVKGKTIFSGDVRIGKSASIKRVNDVDVEELRDDAMLLARDQIVTGNASFAKITARGVNASGLYASDEDSPLKIQRLVVRGSVQVDELRATNITVKGLVDGLSWNDVVRDSVFDDDRAIVRAEKIVDGRVEARQLNLTGTIDRMPFENFLRRSNEEDEEEWLDVVIAKNVSLRHRLAVDDLIFEGSLDTIPSSQFGKDWLLYEGDQTIAAPVIFAELELRSGAILLNETVSGIDLRRMFRDAIKVNDSVHMDRLVAFGNLTAQGIELSGTVNGAAFDETVVLAESETRQTITGDWFFDRDLIINGSLVVDGLLSGINISRFCAMHKSGEASLIVGGSVVLEKEPEILGDVNGVHLERLAEKVWFKNEDATLAEASKSLCTAELHRTATLEGYLNRVNVTNLPKRYLSKTLKRFAPENLSVRNLVIKKFCRIRNARVRGKVNGIDLSEWSKNVLLQDVDQTVTGMYHFDEFETEDLALNGTVNDLDLANGVLRYDVDDAVVTGEKTFLDVLVRDLRMGDGKTVQGVRVDDWAKRALMKSGNFTVSGTLTLHDPIFEKGLIVAGTVNDLIFDKKHILTVRGNQRVTGKKRFDLSGYPNETLRIKELRAEGSVSGVDLTYLIENQAYKNGDLIFTKPATFAGTLTTDYAKVEGLYQGVNVTELCKNLEQAPETRNSSRDYKTLLDEARAINRQLKERAFFLDHYEAVQTLRNGTFTVLPFSFRDKDESVAVISVLKSREMRLMEWDSYQEQFVFSDEEALAFSDNVTFATSDRTDSGSFLYMEIANKSKIFHSVDHLTEIDAKGTSCVASFTLDSLHKSCFFIGQKLNDSRIVCNTSTVDDLQTYQRLETIGTVQASALQVNKDVYVAVINKEQVVDRFENILVLYKFDYASARFRIESSLPEVNPVAVSTTSYRHQHFLALAGGRLPESVDGSIVTVFRLNRENDLFVRYQPLFVDTPVDVHFAVLPTSELALYVLSLNPTKPFIVYLYRGIRGFVEETSGLSLYVGKEVRSFTGSGDEHFVFISGYGQSQILKAGFKGNTLRRSDAVTHRPTS